MAAQELDALATIDETLRGGADSGWRKSVADRETDWTPRTNAAINRNEDKPLFNSSGLTHFPPSPLGKGRD
jgi:hypothetical protein